MTRTLLAALRLGAVLIVDRAAEPGRYVVHTGRVHDNYRIERHMLLGSFTGDELMAASREVGIDATYAERLADLGYMPEDVSPWHDGALVLLDPPFVPTFAAGFGP